MAGNERLQRWWDRLSEQERAEAITARKDGQLSDRLAKSLHDSGLIQERKKPDRTIPPDVDVFLKARH